MKQNSEGLVMQNFTRTNQTKCLARWLDATSRNM